jgi:hypothetical protein
MVGKENQMHRYATVGGGSQDYGTDPRGSEPANYDGSHERHQCNNRFAKSSCKIYENQKSLHYFSDTPSRLGGTQCNNRWHCCNPHGKEGRIECLFDLQYLQLVEIMGYQ